MISLLQYLLAKDEYRLADGRVKRPGPDHLLRIERGLSDRRPAFCRLYARCPDEDGQTLELHLSNAPYDDHLRSWIEAHDGNFQLGSDQDRANLTLTVRGDVAREVSALAKRYANAASGVNTGSSSLDASTRRLCRRIRAELLRFAGDLKAYQVLRSAGEATPVDAGAMSPPHVSRPLSEAMLNPTSGATRDHRCRQHGPPSSDEPDLFAILEELP